MAKSELHRPLPSSLLDSQDTPEWVLFLGRVLPELQRLPCIAIQVLPVPACETRAPMSWQLPRTTQVQLGNTRCLLRIYGVGLSFDSILGYQGTNKELGKPVMTNVRCLARQG